MSKTISSCPRCDTRVRVMRDAVGAVDFVYCVRCGDRAYVIETEWTPMAPDSTWRTRFLAHRLFKALVKLAEQDAPDAKYTARERVVAECVVPALGRSNVGPWFRWTDEDCARFMAVAGPMIEQAAFTLVDGPARVVLHTVVARRSRFPRLALSWRIARNSASVWFTRQLDRLLNRVFGDPR